jgi:hypothetical protein
MIWRYNPLKRELHFYDIERNQILAFQGSFLDQLAKERAWMNTSHDALKKLPISTR